MYGEKRAEEYKEMFKSQPPESNLPKFRIFRGAAPEFINAIQACMTDEKKPEEVAEFQGDDPYDGGRYLIQRVHRYFREAESEHENRQALQKVLDGAHTTFDLYQAMRRYEADQGKRDDAPRRIYTPSQRRIAASLHGKLPTYRYN
jgi:hypothetical protein